MPIDHTVAVNCLYGNGPAEVAEVLVYLHVIPVRVIFPASTAIHQKALCETTIL